MLMAEWANRFSGGARWPRRPRVTLKHRRKQGNQQSTMAWNALITWSFTY